MSKKSTIQIGEKSNMNGHIIMITKKNKGLDYKDFSRNENGQLVHNNKLLKLYTDSLRVRRNNG